MGVRETKGINEGSSGLGGIEPNRKVEHEWITSSSTEEHILLENDHLGSRTSTAKEIKAPALRQTARSGLIPGFQKITREP